MRLFTLLATLLFAVSVAAGPVEDILTTAAADCANFNAGRFDPRGAVMEADLDGDGSPDRLVDEAQFSCSSRPALYCGSGGCMLHSVIGDHHWEFQAEDWRVIEWDGRPILLIARDGGWCGGAGAQQCFEAVVWSGGEPLTVMPAR